jgi:hypothetical protein
VCAVARLACCFVCVLFGCTRAQGGGGGGSGRSFCLTTCAAAPPAGWLANCVRVCVCVCVCVCVW